MSQRTRKLSGLKRNSAKRKRIGNPLRLTRRKERTKKLLDLGLRLEGLTLHPTVRASMLSLSNGLHPRPTSNAPVLLISPRQAAPRLHGKNRRNNMPFPVLSPFILSREPRPRLWLHHLHPLSPNRLALLSPIPANLRAPASPTTPSRSPIFPSPRDDPTASALAVTPAPAAKTTSPVPVVK